MRKISAVLSGVDHVFLFDAGKHLIHEFLTFDSGDAEVVVKVIAAHFGLRGRDFFVKVRHILIAVLHNSATSADSRSPLKMTYIPVRQPMGPT